MRMGFVVAGSGSRVLALPLYRQYPAGEPRQPVALGGPLSLRWATPAAACAFVHHFDRCRATLQPYLDKSLHRRTTINLHQLGGTMCAVWI
jgi:hypothetical protein